MKCVITLNEFEIRVAVAEWLAEQKSLHVSADDIKISQIEDKRGFPYIGATVTVEECYANI